MLNVSIIHTSEKQFDSSVVLFRAVVRNGVVADTVNYFLKNFGDGMSLPPVGPGGRPPLPGGVYLGAHQAGARGTGHGITSHSQTLAT